MEYIETILDIKNKLVILCSQEGNINVGEVSLLVVQFRAWYELLNEDDQKRIRNTIYRRTGRYGHVIVDELIKPDVIDVMAALPEIKKVSDYLESIHAKNT